MEGWGRRGEGEERGRGGGEKVGRENKKGKYQGSERQGEGK